MLSYEFSHHAYDVLKERGIQEAWVRMALEEPERKEAKDDGTIHYIKSIEERGNRHLRVVARSDGHLLRVVTVFFDRRIRRQA